MGLNDFYTQERSQILLMIPLPSVNQAYSMLMSDESQKVMFVFVSNSVLGALPVSFGRNYETTALYGARSTNESGASSSNNFKKFKKNKNLYCEFCKIRNHTKENCYKIIGYPSDKFKKRGGVPITSVHNVVFDPQNGSSTSAHNVWLDHKVLDHRKCLTHYFKLLLLKHQDQVIKMLHFACSQRKSDSSDAKWCSNHLGS